MAKESIKIIIEGGKAMPGPPLAPKVSPMGINVKLLVDDINKATKAFEGIKVPVEVILYPDTKKWELKVGTPPTSQLMLKELKVEKGSGSSWKEGTEGKPATVGNATKEIIVKVAKLKMESMGARTLKNAVKNVLGTCVSAGITVEGKNPKDITKEVNEGHWDSLLK
ncbi:MAG: 50S ribosomal protein L11 [Candidatus Nanoarchaeia archaeon]|nr:50S ribosomal protein L11 [Candidatus Nanoarchaeia archaeon]MDD5239183.1 50S ribosomal protein L11 [Candidatus Nanoarchaeia archaeon]